MATQEKALQNNPLASVPAPVKAVTTPTATTEGEAVVPATPAAKPTLKSTLDLFRHFLPYGLGDKLPGAPPKVEPKPGEATTENKGKWGFNPFSGQGTLSGEHSHTDETGHTTGVNAAADYNVKTGEGSGTGGMQYGPNKADATVAFDKNGFTKVGGSYSYENEAGRKYGLSGNIRRDGFDGGVSTGGKDWDLGLKFDVTTGKITTNDTAQSGDTTSSMFDPAHDPDAASYVSTSRTDSVEFGLDAKVKGIGINADINSGSKTELIQQVDPAKWKAMTPEERKVVMDQQAAALEGYKNGLAGVNLLDMQAGTGVHVTSFNGWNAGGGVTLGAVGVNGGIGQSTASDVTIVRPQDPNAPIMVNVGRQEGLSVKGGVDISGVSLGFGDDKTNTKQTQFAIDPKSMELGPDGKPKDPKTYEAVQLFLQTGLMPGAANLQDPAAQKAYGQFAAARQDVTTLNNQIAEVQKTAATDPVARAELDKLLVDLNNAQSKIDLNRNYLNDEWQQENGPGKQPVPGVTVQGKDETDTEVFTGSVMGKEIGRITESWMSSEYWSSKQTLEQKYGYQYQNVFLGQNLKDFSTTSDTNNSGTMLGLHSVAKLSDDPELLALAAGVDRGTASADYLVQDKSFRDSAQFSLTIEMNEAQLASIGNSMNDMKNPESQAMWADFNSRTTAFASGGKYWLDMDEQVLQGGGVTKERYEDSRDAVRKDWIEQTFNSESTDPASVTLRGYGKTQEEAMAKATETFAKVKGPADFQKLTPGEQQLYMAILDQTSGGEEMTGKRSGYETLACVALIKDPKDRADSMNKLMADTNDYDEQPLVDGGWEYLKFAERFKTSDPATYALIKQGVRLDFTTDQLKQMEGMKTEDLVKEIKGGYESSYLFGGQDPDEEKVVTGMLAIMERQDPAAPPGQSITNLVTETGMDPIYMLSQIPKDKPALRQMYIDMIMQTPYAAELQKNLDAGRDH